MKIMDGIVNKRLFLLRNINIFNNIVITNRKSYMAKFTRALFFLIAFTFLASIKSISAPLNGPILEKGYYIVVAAYFSSQENLAKHYSTQLNEAGKHSKYGFDTARNLYYVYLDYYTDFSESINQMLLARKESGFSDAWVRIIKEGGAGAQPVIAVEEAKREEKQIIEKKAEEKIEEPVVAKKTEKQTSVKDMKSIEPAKVIAKEEVKTEAVKEGSATDDTTSYITTLPTEVIENPKADPVFFPQTLKNTQAFMSLYNATNGKVIDGEIEVIDTERSRLISKVKANSYLNLPDPKSKSGKLTLIGSAFGYRKIQRELNYYQTENDTTQEDIDLIGNFYFVNFDMSHMVKGDIATLYNIYFYNDAAIMLPESKYELNNLLKMMQDDPKYKIRLHGHTNGNGRGKIINMGPEKDFFKITKNDVVNESGTAKELSGARAQVIKDWLIAQGIDASRIDIKAWGGTRMLHDKESQHARKNVRVEVEVLEN
jgi:outer membrane protein OmpA-like peptidoglycan-associated protein